MKIFILDVASLVLARTNLQSVGNGAAIASQQTQTVGLWVVDCFCVWGILLLNMNSATKTLAKSRYAP